MNSTKRKLIFVSLSCLLTTPFGPSTRAALIAYDGADYAVITSVSGRTGGTGWTGGWMGGDNVVAGSLVRDGVATNGNRFVTDGNSGSTRVIETAGRRRARQWGVHRQCREHSDHPLLPRGVAISSSLSKNAVIGSSRAQGHFHVSLSVNRRSHFPAARPARRLETAVRVHRPNARSEDQGGCL